MTNIIKNFMKDNDLVLSRGSRNSTIVILVGYVQHIGWNRQQLLDALSDEISNDKFIGEEVNRLWEYCEDNNYKKFWKTEQAKAQYVF